MSQLKQTVSLVWPCWPCYLQTCSSIRGFVHPNTPSFGSFVHSCMIMLRAEKCENALLRGSHCDYMRVHMCVWGGVVRPCPHPPTPPSRQNRDYLLIAQHSFFVHCWCSISDLDQFLIMFSCSLLHTKQNFVILLDEFMIITLKAKSNSSTPFLKLALKSITL